jgi:putative two-component system response regulator
MFFLALLDNELFQEEVATWNIALILQAAHLHDVGKIAIRDDVLLKPDRLSEEEFEIIKTHVDFGEAIIDKIMKTTSETSFLEQARVLVTSHHEKWDGSGYPRGMKGTEIPLQGRVMAIVDVYDALVDKRPYKEAYSHDQAVQIIVNGSGTHFDPDLITVFQKISDQFRDVRQSA